MRRRKGVNVLLVIAALLVASTMAMATEIDPFNNRPVTVGDPPGSEASLQSILDGMFGIGVVSEVKQDRKLVVTFEDGKRILVHARA